MSKSLYPVRSQKKSILPVGGPKLILVLGVAASILLILSVSTVSTCQSTNKRVTKTTYNNGIAVVSAQVANLNNADAALSKQITDQSLQVKSVSQNVTALSNSVSTIQDDIAAIQSSVQADTAAIQSSLQDIQSSVQGVQTQLDSLKGVDPARIASNEKILAELNDQVAALWKQVAGSSQTVGSRSTTVNGLQVTFLVNNSTVSSVVKQVPLAVKIANTNSYAITNLDVVGSVTMSWAMVFASGYPTLTDAQGAVSYVVTFSAPAAGSSGTIYFETYSTPAGALLSIPAGGSVTLRPIVGLGASAVGLFSPCTFTLSIDTIAYNQS